jgi:hypothetical protein
MTPSRLLAWTAIAAWLLGAAGCSLVLKTDSEQCNVDADCTARGSAFANTMCSANVCVTKTAPPDPKWGCIGDVPAPDAGSMSTYKVQLLDLISNNPVPQGLTIKLCAKFDPTCQSQLATPASDAMGFVSGMVPSDFQGYLDISDPSGNYVPALVFLDLVAMPDNLQVLLVAKSAEGALAQNANVTVDPTASLLLVATVDCTNTRAAGVSVALSPTQASATEFYVINNALLTTAMQTDSSGNMGFVNVAAPTGSASVTVTATVVATGKEMGKVTTLVRAGGMTYQLLRPTTNL